MDVKAMLKAVNPARLLPDDSARQDTIVGLRLSDPAGLFVLGREESAFDAELTAMRDILLAHQEVIDNLAADGLTAPDGPTRQAFARGEDLNALASTVNRTQRQVEEALSGVLEVAVVLEFHDEERALRWAVAMQQRTSEAVSRGGQARLQLGIVLALGSYVSPSDIEGITKLTKDPRVTGGRIVTFGSFYDQIMKRPLGSYYGWRAVVDDENASPVTENLPVSRGRLSTLARVQTRRPTECLYDDAQVLLNAPFERVFAAEMRGWIEPQRRTRGGARPPFPERPHPTNDLVGVALSGGGMRSAVFSLGVVQSLADRGFLRDVDYLSTVSGGAYLGASLSSLCADQLPYRELPQLDMSAERFPFADPRPPALVPPGLRPVHGNESPALKHVRERGKLVGSGIGLFAANTWSLAGQYSASVVLLWALFLLPAFTLAVLGALGLKDFLSHEPSASWESVAWAAVAASLLTSLLFSVTVSDEPSEIRAWLRAASYGTAVGAVVLGLVALVGALPPLIDVEVDDSWSMRLMLLSGGLFVAGWLVFLAVGPSHRALFSAGHWVTGAGAASAGVAVFGFVTLADDAEALYTGWGVLAALSPAVLFVIAAFLSMASLAWGGRWRDGLAPIPSLLSRMAAVLTPILLLLGGVWLFELVLHFDFHLFSIDAVPVEGEATVATAAAAGTAATGFSLAKLWESLGDSVTSQVTDKGGTLLSSLWKVLLVVGGYVTLGLGLSAWSYFVWRAIDSDPRFVAGLGVASAGLVVLTNVLIPRLGLWLLNGLSLNRLYAEMIQNTWVIGASPPADGQVPGPPPAWNSVARWTQVWRRPDIRVRSLVPDGAPASAAQNVGTSSSAQGVVAPRTRPVTLPWGGASPGGPYPLICAALNLPGSTSTKLLDRMSDPFIIAPIYSGSALTRWIKTESDTTLDKMPLAQAAAISGAAVSPNMGTHTTPTLSIVTTLLNVRLGFWLRNPRRSSDPGIKKLFAEMPVVLYWKEMLGRASHEDGQVYLSDGGHFENLGLYELLRRRCRYIVAVSADTGGLDEAFDMGNLGTALRLARVDLGIDVEMPELIPLLHDTKTGCVDSFFAAGTITYPGGSAANPSEEGTLIFIKTGIREDDLSADVLQHWKSHPGFPYDPTTNQQYDQPRFESYRSLGYLAAEEMWKSGDDSQNPNQSWMERFERIRDGG